MFGRLLLFFISSSQTQALVPYMVHIHGTILQSKRRWTNVWNVNLWGFFFVPKPASFNIKDVYSIAMLDNSCIFALSLCITEPSSLPHNCVLDRILHVQTLDQMDIEEIHPLYVKVKEHLASHPQDRWVQISLISILIIFFSWFLFS